MPDGASALCTGAAAAPQPTRATTRNNTALAIGKHEHHLDQYGISEDEVADRFSAYIDRFHSGRVKGAAIC